MLEKLNELFAARQSLGWRDCVQFTVRDAFAPDTCFIMDADGVRGGDGLPADCCLTADKATFKRLINGEIDAMQAYMRGELKIEGSMAVALRLVQFLKG